MLHLVSLNRSHSRMYLDVHHRHRQYQPQVRLDHLGPHQGTCHHQCLQVMLNQVAQSLVLYIQECHQLHKHQMGHHRIHHHHYQGWLDLYPMCPLQCRAFHRYHRHRLRLGFQRLCRNPQATRLANHRHQSLRERLVRM